MIVKTARRKPNLNSLNKGQQFVVNQSSTSALRSRNSENDELKRWRHKVESLENANPVTKALYQFRSSLQSYCSRLRR